MKNLKELFFTLAIILSATMLFAQEKKEDMVFRIVEDMPEYPGGEDAFRNDLMNAVKYPDEAKKNGIQGKVYVSFVVNKEGKVENAKIARGVDPLLDKEALRAIKQLKTWKPGKQRGTLVNVEYTAPINFSLDGKTTKAKEIKDVDGEQVFHVVEDMPEFPGGKNALREFIAKKVIYPEKAKKEKIQGKVYVSFTVMKDGSVSQCEVVRGVHPDLDKEAIRVIKSLPKWKPGSQRGTLVNVRYTMPINFALN